MLKSLLNPKAKAFLLGLTPVLSESIKIMDGPYKVKHLEWIGKLGRKNGASFSVKAIFSSLIRVGGKII